MWSRVALYMDCTVLSFVAEHTTQLMLVGRTGPSQVGCKALAFHRWGLIPLWLTEGLGLWGGGGWGGGYSWCRLLVGEPWFQNGWLFGFVGPETKANRVKVVLQRASQVVLVVKNLPANEEDIRDVGSIPPPGRSPGGGLGNSLQYSCLEISWAEEPSWL